MGKTYIGLVKSVGEENSVPCRGRENLLLRRDQHRAREVVHVGDNGLRGNEDILVCVGDAMKNEV